MDMDLWTYSLFLEGPGSCTGKILFKSGDFQRVVYGTNFVILCAHTHTHTQTHAFILGSFGFDSR